MKLCIRLVAAVGAASSLPVATWACSACAAGDPKNAATYLGMTLVMSALPLLLVGCLVYWLWRRYS